MGLEMTITGLLIMASVMTALALAWFGLHYLLNPRMENPDGIAKVTGSCGDTMEIALKFNGSRVEDVHCWTDGCAISKMCVETVGMLARGKTVPELRTIDTAAILERVGQLPETHMHCAVLAETTLQKAVSFYTLKNPDVDPLRPSFREAPPRHDGQNSSDDAALKEQTTYVVYLFPSVSYVMKAEKILKEREIVHKVIPVPRHISSDCGVCLRIPADQQERVTEALRGKVAWENTAEM